MNMLPQKPIILIADDDEAKAFLLQSKIESTAIPAMVLIATDAATALALIKEHKPDLLLLDGMLPESSINAHIPTDEVYRYSAPVAAAYKEECPKGTIVLYSSYGLEYARHFPPGTQII